MERVFLYQLTKYRGWVKTKIAFGFVTTAWKWISSNTKLSFVPCLTRQPI